MVARAGVRRATAWMRCGVVGAGEVVGAREAKASTDGAGGENTPRDAGSCRRRSPELMWVKGRFEGEVTLWGCAGTGHRYRPVRFGAQVSICLRDVLQLRDVYEPVQ